jgi:serine/threonine protein kinase
VGTKEFVAPEVTSETRFSPKSDVWSLGVTFYRMICGENPWTYCNDEKKWINKLKIAPTVPFNTVPLWLKTAIYKMLTFDENFRPSAS